MGQRIIQRIYTCDICAETPKDGEKLWHMSSEVWCEKCCEDAENKDKETQRKQLSGKSEH